MMKIREMRTLLGDTQQKFSDRYGIPKRTLQTWEYGTRECPGYVKALLERVVIEDSRKEGKA